jgi:hypothetical protein
MRIQEIDGVSSAASTGSFSRAARIALSNPASSSRDDSRSLAPSTNPGETGTPGSMPIRSAARSGGTLP